METLDKLARAVSTYQEPKGPCYHLFLTRSLSQGKTRKRYKILASLIQSRYFSVILTANEDTELEDALSDLGLKYSVLVIGQHADAPIVDALDSEDENSIYIVKLAEAGLPIVSFSNLSDSVRRSLEKYFTRNIIIVGYMDQEDIGISALASHKDSGIYYILENDPPATDIVVQCIKKSGKDLKNFLITGPDGEFNSFFSALYAQLKMRVNQRQTPPPDRPPIIPKIPPIIRSQNSNTSSLGEEPLERRPTGILPETVELKRPTVFISYSHKDDMHLERLRVHLKPLAQDRLINVNACDSDKLLTIDVWSDKNIKPGANWHREIMQAMEAATMAILLLSADFLASDFIRNVELPFLLKMYDQGSIILLTVIVSPCNYGYTRLADIQSVNKASAPLSKDPSYSNETVWAEVAEIVRKKVTPTPLS